MIRRLIPIVLASGALASGTLTPLSDGHNAGAQPSPPNDNFASAVAIASLPFNDLNVNTSGATTEPGEPLPSLGDCTDITKTVWYRFTPAANVVLQGDTFGSGFDTVLAIYTGTGFPSLTNIACNDDAGLDSLQSKVVFSAAAGVTYRFQVGGFPGLDESGSLDFHLAVASAPINDDFTNAKVITAIPFSDGPFGTAGATTQSGEPPGACASIGKTVWYDFTPSTTMGLRADTLGGDYDTVVAVYTGASLNMLTSVACNDDAPEVFQSQLDFSATGGTTYHFQVGGFSGANGNLVFHLALAVSDADSDGVPDASDNCPNWPNPAQTLPPWPVPPNDPDCDGFSSAIETSAGTNASLHCGIDAWPPDINNDTFVDIIGDIAAVANNFSLSVPPAPLRHDIAPDPPNGFIDVIGDLATMAGFFGKNCL